MTNREIITAQSQQVAIGNDLIQKARYKLSKREQKIVLFMVSKIKPNDEPDTEYTFSFKEFEEVCRLKMDGGRDKKEISEMLLELKRKPLEIPLDGKRKLISSWFNEAIVDEEKQTMKMTFSKYLMPYLFYLQEYYTQFTLQNVLPMKSKYSIRLFEYMKSIKSLGHKHTITVEELRERMGLEENTLKAYKDFRIRALEPAVEEVNKYTDIKLEYREYKTSRRITSLEFIITLNEEVKAYKNRMEALGMFPNKQ